MHKIIYLPKIDCSLFCCFGGHCINLSIKSIILHKEQFYLFVAQILKVVPHFYEGLVFSSNDTLLLSLFCLHPKQTLVRKREIPLLLTHILTYLFTSHLRNIEIYPHYISVE